MESQQRAIDHWFNISDCYVAVSEFSPPVDSWGTLFFVHGRYGHRGTWWPIISDLQHQFHCFTIDLPGYGRSYTLDDRGLTLQEHASLVAEIIRRVAPESIVMVGHDIGGAIAQFCTIEHSAIVDGVVLLNSSCLAMPLSSIPVSWGWLGGLWKFMRLAGQSSCLTEDFRSEMMDPWRNYPGRRKISHSFHTLEATWPGHEERRIWKKSLESISQPVLLLWGEQDSLNDLERAFELVRILPEVHYFQHQYCGHWPYLEDPEWVIGRVREFLFRVVGPRRSAKPINHHAHHNHLFAKGRGPNRATVLKKVA